MILWLLLCSVEVVSFVSIWSPSADEILTLPFFGDNYNLTISWGDGNQENLTSLPISHKYNSTKEYEISIEGQVRDFSCNFIGCSKLVSISSWGEFVIDSNTLPAVFGGSGLTTITATDQPIFHEGAVLSSMFANCTFLNSSLPFVWDLTNVTSLDSMFANAPSFNGVLNFTRSSGVTNLTSMFSGASGYNQAFSFDARNVVDTSYMFSDASAFDSLLLLEDTSRVISMRNMFANARSYNQITNLNTASVQTMESMFFGASTFDKEINFDSKNVLSMVFMFAHCSMLNSPITFSNTSNVVDMQQMFYSCSLFNQPLNFDTRSVTSLFSMFYWAEKFNSPFVFSDTSNVRNFGAMFIGCISFNQPINFVTTKATNLALMFNGCRNFNQVINFLTEGVLSMELMFFNCRVFDSTITFSNTESLTNIDSMFNGATVFNRPLPFTTTKNVIRMSRLFANAKSFNQPVNIDTSSCTTMGSMFVGCSAFNMPVLFNTSLVTDMSSMFNGATKFNQEVNFFVPEVATMSSMFLKATSFNHKINFYAPKVFTLRSMFSEATSFNSEVKFFNTTLLSDVTSMFFKATSFNQSVAIDTSAVLQMSRVFQNATNFDQNLSSWNASNTFECAQFCTRCTLPFFSNCNPCAPTPVVTSPTRGGVCTCPVNEPLLANNVCDVASLAPTTLSPTSVSPTSVSPSTSFPSTLTPSRSPVTSTPSSAPTSLSPSALTALPSSAPTSLPPSSAPTALPSTSAPSTLNSLAPTSAPTQDLCVLAQYGNGLQGACLAPNQTAAPKPTPAFVIVSPIINITTNGSEEGMTFAFTLPINAQAIRQTITQSCFGQKITCEWQDPVTKVFLQSGCQLASSDVDMGGGVKGAQCVCTHLTVFALALRTELQQEAMCQAETVDYALLVLYGILMGVLVVQVCRLAKAKAAKSMAFYLHFTLLVACLLRVCYLIAKPVIGSLAGLVFLGLIPSALSLALFLHVLLAWVSLQSSSLKASPFAKFRKPFIVIVTCVFLLILAIVIAVAAIEDLETQEQTVIYGSYLFAALYACVCFMILASGLGLNKMLAESSHTNSTTGGTKDWRVSYRIRVLLSTFGISLSLFISSCLWIAAVQNDIITSYAATLSVTAVFYVVDWLSLCMLSILFSPVVNMAVKKRAASTSLSRDKTMTGVPEKQPVLIRNTSTASRNSVQL